MDANARDLAQVFGRSCRYVVPLFQRSYVWQQDSEWEPLWFDLQAVVERKLDGGEPSPHFLGAVVLEQLSTATGALKTRQVIDGQQRLTTLQALMVAVRDVCAANDGPKHAAALEPLLCNDDPYLDDEDHRFKVWPTNVDRDAYRAVMTAQSPAALCAHFNLPAASTHVGHGLGDAYLYFCRTLDAWLREQTMDREVVLKALVMSIRGSLRFVVIDLDRDDDPQMIFETLNARGTPLLAVDLVKNYLFQLAARRGESVERLYKEYWRKFDRDSGFWREEVRQGRLRHPRINIFLQHYLTLRLKREVRAGHTFLVFRGMAAEASCAEPLMKEMAHYGRIYRSMHGWPLNCAEALFFYRLNLLDTSTVVPFLMHVFSQLGSPDREAERRAVLRDIESFLVRRLICGLTTKNYNRLFLDLLTWTQANGLSPSSVRGFRLSGDGPSVRWPSDEEFKAAWLTHPLYKNLVQQRLRMILEALDLSLRSDLTEQVHLPDKLTIEHVLPQSWAEHWPLPEIGGIEERLVAEAERNDCLHRIGNLTLLTKKLNPGLSNSAWENKRTEITRHSALNMNRYFHETSEWNEAEISKRSALLFDRACKIWPHPLAGQPQPVPASVSPPPAGNDDTPNGLELVRSRQSKGYSAFVVAFRGVLRGTLDPDTWHVGGGEGSLVAIYLPAVEVLREVTGESRGLSSAIRLHVFMERPKRERARAVVEVVGNHPQLDAVGSRRLRERLADDLRTRFATRFDQSTRGQIVGAFVLKAPGIHNVGDDVDRRVEDLGEQFRRKAEAVRDLGGELRPWLSTLRVVLADIHL